MAEAILVEFISLGVAQVYINIFLVFDVLPSANGYGYYWWRRKTNGHQAFVAVGYGGQIICIVPDLRMIIVTTCFLGEKNRGRIELKKLHGFIDQITK